MGLDLSLTSTGVSVGGVTRSIKSKKRGASRLIEIKNIINEIAKNEKIEIVAIEAIHTLLNILKPTQ